MNENVLNGLFEYAVKVRRELHRIPEIGFDLPKTVGAVKAELDRMGIACTEKYGECSLVADLGKGDFCIGLRADMDALPVEEKVDLPFKSEHPGAMHACGHDSHTAVLLAVAAYLKEHEAELPCRVRLMFQPSEEGQVSGAKMMVDNGVMDGVDVVVATHCDNGFDAGFIGLHPGDYQAACIPATIRFIGRSTHAALPEYGIDAIAMANEAYGRMREMVKNEAGDIRYIWSVGRFQGGHVHNVVADRCEMDISFRFYDIPFSKRVAQNVFAICDEIASRYGGRVEYDWNMSTGPVYNDPGLSENFRKIAEKSGLATCDIPARMSSEDFGWYLGKAPGMLFRFGTRNEKTGCTALAHRSEFCMDESGMKPAIAAFIAYVMHGGKCI